MNPVERESLNRIATHLREKFPERIAGIYAFGSRVRGDHGEWSDFDVLVVVRDRDPSVEKEIIGLLVDEEMRTGISLTPLVKDLSAYELEKLYHTPFYNNILTEGVSF